MRVLICGSRTWTDEKAIEDYIKKLPRDAVVILGDAEGADAIADRIAIARGHTVIKLEANWKLYGDAAGPIRNQKMLDWKPDKVAAFHIGNSPGTQDMIDRARKAQIVPEVFNG